MEITTFDEMKLDVELIKALKAIDYTTPSPIQAKAIPVALTGVDIIGQAQTGTGKTAAFGIPMIQNISKEGSYTKGLVLCPTRELCIQVSNELKKLAAFTKHINVYAIFGGEPITPQIKALKSGIEIVVGTPGRIMDHIDRGTLKLDKLEILALDEADEMLNMGFREDLEKILQSVSEHRQTILFSATMPKAIMDITHLYQKSPKLIKVTPAQLTAVNVEQYFIDTDMKSRIKVLIYLLSQDNFQQAIVFCNTKAGVDDLSNQLAASQLKNDVLHGDLSQERRNRILNKFRKGEFKVLVATDVAARGIDVPNVDLVCNYDISFDPEYYVHRVGRTGRAGKQGKAYSFVAGARDKRLLRQIESFAKVTIQRFKLPDAKEVDALETDKLKNYISQIVTAGHENAYIEMAKNVVPDGVTTLQALAALLLKFVPKSKFEWMQSSSPANDVYSGRTNRKVRDRRDGGKSDRRDDRREGGSRSRYGESYGRPGKKDEKGKSQPGKKYEKRSASGYPVKEHRKGKPTSPVSTDNEPSLEDILTGLGIKSNEVKKPKKTTGPVAPKPTDAKKRTRKGGDEPKSDTFYSQFTKPAPKPRNRSNK